LKNWKIEKLKIQERGPDQFIKDAVGGCLGGGVGEGEQNAKGTGGIHRQHPGGT
jgi:hypothetical protein